jgi:hypothetical protein
MVGAQGFEPWTNGLKVRCSTAELYSHIVRIKLIYCANLDHTGFQATLRFTYLHCFLLSFYIISSLQFSVNPNQTYDNQNNNCDRPILFSP